jgi:rod shape-determining protein MreD
VDRVLAWSRVAVVAVVLLIAQLTLMSDLRIAGSTGDLLVLIALCAALAGGQQVGAISGFICGILVDLTLQTPFGLSALVYAVLAYLVGLLQASVLRPTWWLAPLTVGVASALSAGLLAIGLVILGPAGTELQSQVLVDMAVVGGLNAMLAPAVIRIARVAVRPVAPTR